jgi:sugar phosphate isomerase/epimerase
MTGNIQAGFTMHPRWAQIGGGFQAFLEPLRAAGLTALEFELDSRIDLWEGFEPMMDKVITMDYDLSFHAPYRLPHSLVDFAGKNRQTIITDYQPMLNIAQRYAQTMGAAKTVVIHGARAINGNHPALLADTTSFIDWLLNEYPELNFALENNNPNEPGVVKVGETRAEVLEIVRSVGSPHLGICWDMGHDYLGHRQEKLTNSWLKHIRHVHLHDVDEHEIDHYPLIFDRVPHPAWLAALKKAGMQGIVVLELKGWLLKDYSFKEVMTYLTESIAMITAEVQ